MSKTIWTRAIKQCADPVRAKHFFESVRGGTGGKALETASEEQARIWTTLFSGSQALSELLVKHPDWIKALEPDRLKFPRRKQGLRQELVGALKSSLESGGFGSALAQVRAFKARELLRIGTRDLARLGNVSQITQELSDVADVCLEAVWDICRKQAVERYGMPFHQDSAGWWQPTSGCVLGLGKLGGQELNYSSDVDLMFVYTEEGSVFKEAPSGKQAGRPVLASHQFFNRLAEAVVGEVTRLSPEGMLYRVDLRLRPEGDSGPLGRSLPGYENYYAQWGQTWERMMLIKARGVAGDQALAAEFLEMVNPFRYPRSVNESVLGEIGAMKDRIENEILKPDELDRNVKLGRGGIREIEFIAQSFQLLHGGRQPFLQGAQTLPCLEKLIQYDLLARGDARALQEAYCFLRDVEHRLQMEDNRQTHTIPARGPSERRLARLMGFASLAEFESAHRAHRTPVRRIFEEVLKTEAASPVVKIGLPAGFDGAESEWTALLGRHGFKDPAKAFRVLREFVHGPGYVHLSRRTSELAYQLLPRIFALCPPEPAEPSKASARSSEPDFARTRPPLSDPDRVATRLDSFISAYGARATLFELWNSNPSLFELLLLLFDRSEFLAELAIRNPDLVDDLVTSGRLRQRKSVEETLRDLRHGLEDTDQMLWLRRYHQAELMRIGLRDILGLADFEQYLTELSALADACLQYALEAVMRRHKLKSPPFAIIGLGKLGGAEIDYGSDLDILFVGQSSRLGKAASLALEVMELLATRTEQGLVFHTDARLRPDGEKGLLVNSIEAYESYYRQRAQLWEIQTLTRARVVAGHSPAGEEFERMAVALANFKDPSLPLAAFTPDWKTKIHQMRMRIERERTPENQGDLAIKTGAGGLMDVEFIAQSLCLEHGWREPNTLRSLERGRKEGVLPRAEKLIENYRKLRRVEGILRRWSYEGETVLPHDPAPFYRVSVRCGFTTPESFRRAVADWRRTIREVYEQVFRP